MKSIIKGLIASLVIGYFFSVIYLFGVGATLDDLRSVFFLSFAGAFTVLGVTICWGLPCHFLLKNYGKQSVKWYVVIGAVPSSTILFDSFFNQYPINMLVGGMLFFAIVGTVTAMAFWYVVVFQKQ